MSNPNPILGRAGEEMLRRFAQFRPQPGEAPADTTPTQPVTPQQPKRMSADSDPTVMIADLIRRALFGAPGEDMTTLPTAVVHPPEENPDPALFNDQGIPFQAMVAPSIADSGRVFRRSGKLLVDVTTRRWRDGKTSTHNIALLPPEVQHGEMNVQQYEDLVLARPRNLFSQDVQKATNSLDVLEPDVKTRFEQLREAARREGINLGVNETRRSQERQDWLFQQGRSRPGPIVTWTLTSDHREGRALDLRAPNQKGYEWLWNNAERFGFKSMGEIDPGHIYVPRDQVDQSPANFGDVSSGASSRRTGGGQHSSKQRQPG